MRLARYTHKQLARAEMRAPVIMRPYDSQAMIAAANYWWLWPIVVNQTTGRILTPHIFTAHHQAKQSAYYDVIEIQAPQEREIGIATILAGGLDSDIGAQPIGNDFLRGIASMLLNRQITTEELLAVGRGDTLSAIMGYIEKHGFNRLHAVQSLEPPEIIDPRANMRARDMSDVPVAIPSAESPASYSDLYLEVDRLGIPRLATHKHEKRSDTAVLTPHSDGWVRWGQQSRTLDVHAVHFYTDDSKFSALLNEDEPSLPAINWAIEPNVSISPLTPLAIALGAIYHKRRIAQILQQRGTRIVIDLFVPRRYAAHNLIGVPQGYLRYANRYRDDDPEHLGDMFDVATKHAGTSKIKYWVYGSSTARKFCASYGWHWIDSDAFNQPIEPEEAING